MAYETPPEIIELERLTMTSGIGGLIVILVTFLDGEMPDYKIMLIHPSELVAISSCLFGERKSQDGRKKEFYFRPFKIRPVWSGINARMYDQSFVHWHNSIKDKETGGGL